MSRAGWILLLLSPVVLAGGLVAQQLVPKRSGHVYIDNYEPEKFRKSLALYAEKEGFQLSSQDVFGRGIEFNFWLKGKVEYLISNALSDTVFQVFLYGCVENSDDPQETCDQIKPLLDHLAAENSGRAFVD